MKKFIQMAARHSKILLGLVAVAGCLLSTSIAFATNYYVGKNGNNAYTCVQAQNAATPKLTISESLKCVGSGVTAGSGHTVIVKSGNYDEEFYNNLPGGVSWANPFTLKANVGDVVTIRPTRGACGGAPCFIFTMWNVGYIVIEGFVLDASNVVYAPVKLDCNVDGSGKSIGCAHHIRIINAEIFDSSTNCIYSSIGDTYHEFINLKVHGCGMRDEGYAPGHMGFYITGNHNLVERCTVYDANGGGISAWNQSAAAPSYNTFRNNIVYNITAPRAGGTRTDHNGISMYRGRDNQAYNNIVYNIYGPGIEVEYGCTDCKVYNNTVHGAVGPYGIGIRLGAQASGTIVKNNIVWGNVTDIDDKGSGTTVSNNLTSDPKFINASGKDYRLQSTSPAINAGVNLAPTVVTDILGTPRPQENGYDIGAYEFTGQSSDTTPPNTPTNVRVQ